MAHNMFKSVNLTKFFILKKIIGLLFMLFVVFGVTEQGHANLVAAIADGGQIYVIDSNGDGTFQNYRQVGALPSNTRGITLGDFDEDGDLDIIIGHYADGVLKLVPFFNDGSGTFAQSDTIDTMRSSGSWSEDMTCGDFNNDTHLDFIANGDSGKVMVYLGDGAGGFSRNSFINTEGNGRGLDTGDFDEDGNLDFIRAVYSSGNVSIYFGDGTGSFAPGIIFTDAGSDSYGVAAGDFDNDGHLDLFINDSHSGDAHFYKGDGAGNFAAPVYQISLETNNHGSFDAYDYNNDCNIDIVLSTYIGYGLWFYPGNGDGTFGTAVQLNKDDQGNASNTASAVLSIAAPPLTVASCQPVAMVTADSTTVNAGTTINFNASASTDDGTIVNYAWDYGDTTAVVEGAALTAPSHAFSAEGTYTVTLTVTDDTGRTDSADLNIIVKGDAPLASAGGPYTFTEADARFNKWWALLNASGSTDTEGIVTYAWDFGDVFTQDFEDSNDTGWGKEEGTWGVTDTGTSIVYAQTNGTADRTRNIFEQILPNDYIAQVDVQMISGAGNEAILLFDALDMNNNFELILRGRGTNEHDLLLYRRANNSASALLEVEFPFQIATGPYRLKVQVQGNTLKAYVDDALIFTQTIARFSGPRHVGLCTFQTSAQFDNLKVTHLPNISSTEKYHKLFTTTGIHNVTLTVTDASGQSSTDSTTVTITGGNPPTADAGEPYTLGETDTFSGKWYLFADPSGASDDGNIYKYQWDFGDGTTLVSNANSVNESFTAAGQVHYGYDVPNARLFFTALQNATTSTIINLATGTVVGTVNLNQYGTAWHDGPGDYIPYKIISNKPILVNETNGSGHSSFIPALDGNGIGHEFTFYYYTPFGTHYIFAIEDTYLEIYDTSGNIINIQSLSAGSYKPLNLADGQVFTLRSTGKIAVQTIGGNSFTAVPSSIGDGTGRLFYAAVSNWGGGSVAVFAHETAQVAVFDMDTNDKLYDQALASGETWFQASIGNRRLRVESTGDIEFWAGDNEGGTGIDNMGDDLTFIGGHAQKDFYFRAGNDGAVLFVPYSGTSITINGTTDIYGKDDYQVLTPQTDYHITASKPVFIQILGKATAWNDFGGYLSGIVSPFHAFAPNVDLSDQPYTISMQAIDHLGQISESSQTTLTLVPGTLPVADAGQDQSFDESGAVDGTWTLNFTGAASTDDHGIYLYEWDFGDGATATGLTPAHTYTKTGVYTVTLTVTDHAMQTHSNTLSVTIAPNDPPVADAGSASSQDETDAVNGQWSVDLDGTGSQDDVQIIRYIWDLGTDSFDSYAFNKNKWFTKGNISQYEELASTGTGSWDNTFVFSTANDTRAAGMFMQARVKQTGGHAMIGFKNTSTTDTYTAMPHAIYFDNSTLRIYEDGNNRNIPLHYYSFNTWYDIKIELKVPSGALYYYRPDGDTDWILLYDSNYGDNAELKQGVTVYSGTLVMDDLKNIAAGISPTVHLYGSSDITLTVEDNAHQISTDTTSFSVTTNGQAPVGPVADAGGPYSARDGLPIVLEATGSSSVRPIVAYQWETDDGRTFSGHKALVPFYNSNLYYPVGATASSQYSTGNYSAMKATGEPDVPNCSDHPNAWTTSSADMGEQWLELTYEKAITASGVTVHETSAPGFVTRIDFYDAQDNAVTVWTGTDTTVCNQWLFANVSPAVETTKVRVYINSDIAGWNEIDTVALIENNTSAVSHVTLKITDSLGLTSTDTASITVTPDPTVITAPWQFHGGSEVPHDTWDGKQVLLKAVAYDSQPSTLTYTWDFGDGSAQETGTVSNAYAIETTHVYNGLEGKLYTATITITDIEGNTHSDTYPIVIRGQKIDTEINVAIDDGLWWLHKNQYRNPGDYYHGRWSSYSSYYSSPTASAIQAFEITGHLEAGDLTEDPYVETVWNGMDFLFKGGMDTVKIGMHTLGNPDSNSNGFGVQASEGTAPYQTGMLIDALVASSTPNEKIRLGNINIVGKKYSEIAQDMVDIYAWGMSDDYTNIASLGKNDYIGGWRYNWGDWPDNSACQWAAIGLIPAEKEWSLTIPEYVKTYNNNWLWYSFTGNKFGYTNTGDGNGSSIATRPSGMVQLVMNGKHDLDPADPRWTATEGFFANATNWDWFIYQNNTYYGWYAFTKAMRLAGKGETLSNGFNWFRGNDATTATWGIARRLIELQEKTGANRGRWVDGGQVTHPGYYGNVFDSAWSVIMLVPDLFNLPPVANAGGNRVWGEGISITFDGSGSRHIDPVKNIVLYEWDFDGDGKFDIASVSPIVKHTYDFTSAGGTLPVTVNVTLRVTDNGNSLDPPETPLQDTDTVTVTIVEPPHAPVSMPGGPYTATVGVPVTLNGSRSHDIDDVGADFITLFEWDLDGDWDFDDEAGMDVEGDRETAGIIQYTFNHPGTYNIGLRVTDNGVFNDLNSNGTVDPDEKFIHTAFTTVTVTDNKPPVAVLPLTYTIPEGTVLKLDGTGSYDPNNTAIGTFEWDLNGDGIFDNATGPTAEYLWSQNGIYTVALRLTDLTETDLQDTAQSTITVVNVGPKVDAGEDIVLFGSLTAQVNGKFFDPAGDRDGPFTIQWNFGDGGSAATLKATHTFAATGTYTVTLQVTDKDGGVGSDTLTVQQVVNPVPVVTDASNTIVSLSWNTYQLPPGLDHYALYQSESAFTNVSGMTPLKTLAKTTSQAVITDLTNDSTYYFAVVSVSGTGTFNPEVSAVAATPRAVDTTPPQPVTGLRAMLMAENKVRLTWTRSISPDTALYLIFGDNGTGTMDWTTPLATVAHPAQIWTSGSLTLNTTYQFGVRAQDGVPNTEENTDTASIVIDYPDLVVTVESGPSAIDYNQTAAFVLSVKNQGNAAVTGPMNLGVYVDDQLLKSFEILSSISAGATVQVPASWQVVLKSQTDPYPLIWKIDSEQIIPESDETNNSSSEHLLTVNTVHFMEVGADPEFALQGGDIKLSATATNSNDIGVLLDNLGEDAVTVSTTLWSRGVAVAGPFAFTFDSQTATFEYSLDTKGLWGPFTASFKLYDINQNVVATGQKDIVIGALDYYVNVADGSDALGDGSQLSPWQTITYSLSQIQSPVATLHIAAGVYSDLETFPIHMKPGVKLLGEGNTQPQIKGQIDRSVLFFPGNLIFTSDTKIENLTIENGSIGIQMQVNISASPVIKNARIINNLVGIRCQGQGACSPEITDTTISNNAVNGMEILGLSDDSNSVCAPIIRNCRFDHNGNAIYIEANGNLNNNIHLAPVISQTTIINQTGSGILAVNNGGKWNSAPEITIEMTNLLISKNAKHGISLNGTGGLLTARITNATIVDNAVGIQAQSAEPVISNTVIWGNNTAVIGVTPANVEYSDIDAAEYDGVGTNIFLPPLFEAPDTGNYKPVASSPLVDAGTLLNAPDIDLLGLLRPIDGNNDATAGMDIGAFEVQFHVNAGDDQSIREGDQIDFTGIAVGGGTYSYHWDFGDGQTSDQQTISHIYKNEGTYWARLTVIDTEDNQVVDLAMITVKTAYAPGDFNGDTQINLNDVTTVLKVLTRKDSGKVYISTDANNDGKIDMIDAIIVLESEKGSE
ncbi:MAG: PKD domain-containing protein [Pseudomonadota bacterium]